MLTLACAFTPFAREWGDRVGAAADRVTARVTGIQFRVRLGAGRRPPRPAPPKMLAKSLCESAATIRSVLAHLIHPTLACMPEPSVSES